MASEMRAAPLRQDQLSFRDLNQNGRLDPYEDPHRPTEERVEDLLSQLTLEEKAGLLFHPMIPLGKDGALVEGGGFSGTISTSRLVREQLISHFNIYESAPPRLMAEWYNKLQALVEQTRLGIPITISSDPLVRAAAQQGCRS